MLVQLDCREIQMERDREGERERERERRGRSVEFSLQSDARRGWSALAARGGCCQRGWQGFIHTARPCLIVVPPRRTKREPGTWSAVRSSALHRATQMATKSGADGKREPGQKENELFPSRAFRAPHFRIFMEKLPKRGDLLLTFGC